MWDSLTYASAITETLDFASLTRDHLSLECVHLRAEKRPSGQNREYGPICVQPPQDTSSAHTIIIIIIIIITEETDVP